jgi:hypothetical protein
LDEKFLKSKSEEYNDLSYNITEETDESKLVSMALRGHYSNKFDFISRNTKCRSLKNLMDIKVIPFTIALS